MKTIEQLGISPTPWNQGERTPYGEEHVLWCNYHDKDGIPSTRIVAECNARFSSEQARTDARLIAAAPDLYEALRLWVEELCEDCQAEIGKTCDGKCEAVRRAVAALEKAGGKE